MTKNITRRAQHHIATRGHRVIAAVVISLACAVSAAQLDDLPPCWVGGASIELGLDPSTASSLLDSPELYSAVLDRLGDNAETWALVQLLELDLEAARDAVDVAIRRHSADPVNSDTTVDLLAAEAEFVSSAAAYDTARGDLVNSITNGLATAADVALLTRTDAAFRSLPPEFRLAAATKQDAVAIYTALQAEHQALRQNSPVPAAIASQLNALRNDASVSIAAERRIANAALFVSEFSSRARNCRP